MGLWKWCCRMGTPGQTARTLTEQYYLLKRRYPDATESELCRMVVQLRQVAGVFFSREQRARLEMLRPCSLELLVYEIVKIEHNVRGSDDLGFKRYSELILLVFEEVTKLRAKLERSQDQHRTI